MMKFKTISILLILMFLLLGSSSFAVVSHKIGTGTGLSSTKTSALKVTGIVKKIQKNVLYLESGKKYNLNGVRVIKSKGKAITPSKKRMAEMFFINGILKEVTIR